MNKRIKSIKKEINELEMDIEKAFVRLEEAHKERFLTCSLCHSKSKVKNCTAIDYRSWDCNTGSPNGGFHSHDYYAWECPKCGCFISHKIEKDLYFEMSSAFKTDKTVNRNE